MTNRRQGGGASFRIRLTNVRLILVRCCERTLFPLDHSHMSKVILGLIAGIVFGALDVGLMLPMSFPDKSDRTRSVHLPAASPLASSSLASSCPAWPGWLVGLVVRSAHQPSGRHHHTQVAFPILVLGAIGGLVIGGLIHGGRADV